MNMLKKLGGYITAIAVALLGFLFITKEKPKSRKMKQDPRVKELLADKDALLSDTEKTLESARVHIEQAKAAIKDIENDVAARQDIPLELKVDDWNK